MPTDDLDLRDKSSRGNASQFFIAGELCRRGYSAVVTLGNTPNVDILCSNQKGTRFAHIQVKTFVPGNKTCSVGLKKGEGSVLTFDTNSTSTFSLDKGHSNLAVPLTSVNFKDSH